MLIRNINFLVGRNEFFIKVIIYFIFQKDMILINTFIKCLK